MTDPFSQCMVFNIPGNKYTEISSTMDHHYPLQAHHIGIPLNVTLSTPTDVLRRLLLYRIALSMQERTYHVGHDPPNIQP